MRVARHGFERVGAEGDVSRPVRSVGVGARGWGRFTHDAHVGHGFLVLRGGRSLPSLAVVLRGRQVHELDGIDHRRLGFGVVRHALRVGVQVVFQTVEAGKNLESTTRQHPRPGGERDRAHSPWEGKGLGRSNTPYNRPGRGCWRIATGSYSSRRDAICTCAAPSQVITMKKVRGMGWRLGDPSRLDWRGE